MEKKNQHQINKEIEELIADKDRLKRKYRDEEKDFIKQYLGAGGLGDKGAKGQGLLYEFYTPSYLVGLMWQLAKHHGFKGGAVLEPSCGTGRFFEPAKADVKMTGFEVNKTSARIAQILYPKAKIYNLHFEQALTTYWTTKHRTCRREIAAFLINHRYPKAHKTKGSWSFTCYK